MAGSKASEIGLTLPRVDTKCSDILAGSSLAEFPQVAILEELSLVVALLLLTKIYAPSTMRATAAAPPTIMPTICAVFHPVS